MVVSMVVPVAVKMAKDQQTKTQANNFLDRANKDIFEPRGLIAMITTFNNQKSQTIQYDTRYANGVEDSASAGHFSLPRSAQLEYLDDGEVSTLQQRIGMAKTGHFMGDYFDRRAQFQYAQNNPQYQDPNRPQPRFANGFSDPANHTSLVGVLSGGLIQRPSRGDRRQDRRDRKDERKGRRRSSDSGDGRQRRVGLIGSVKGMVGGPQAQNQGLVSMVTSNIGGRQSGGVGQNPGLLGGVRGMVSGPGGQNQNQGLIKGLKSKIAQEDLLYLMIVERSPVLGSGGAQGSGCNDNEVMDAGLAQGSGSYSSATYGVDDTRR